MLNAPFWRVVFDFYNNLNHFYGAIVEFCGPHQCQTMSAASE